MKTGIIIPARYDSKRLPGKVLEKINGKEVLLYIYERLKMISRIKDIVVATSSEESDNRIAEFCLKNYIECFRGPKDDVAARMLDCANSYGFDYFVRINGDNIFADFSVIEQMIEIATKGGYDFVNNVNGRTFPAGMSVEILNSLFYGNIIKHFKGHKYNEHVTSYLYEHEPEMNSFVFLNTICPEAKYIKLALDDDNDLRFIEWIVGKMKRSHTSYSLKEIYELSKGYRA
ncbi:MAG: hypothetical protein ABH843_07630 [Candidatus Omnitrophota bacterium]